MTTRQKPADPHQFTAEDLEPRLIRGDFDLETASAAEQCGLGVIEWVGDEAHFRPKSAPTKLDRLYAAELASVHATSDLLDVAAGRNPTLAEPFRAILHAATPAVKPVPMWRGVKIHASFIYPPIPDRSHDWCARTDNYDGTDGGNEPLGYGPTEQAAITDLIEQLEDEADDAKAGAA